MSVQTVRPFEEILDLDTWATKGYKNPNDLTPADTFNRVSSFVASNEKDTLKWTDEFLNIISTLEFMPGGRIMAGAGTNLNVSLNNCYVIGDGVPDDMKGIFETLTDSALTMQAGGGIGLDFSTLRPKGAPVKGVNSFASGPISFMRLWDAQCETIMSAGLRRGAQMGIMRCDHPDIEEFIGAKRGDDNRALKNFNLSVAVTSDFMKAVAEDKDWNLVFGGKTFKTVRARDLWDKIMRQNYDYAEPGVVFIDRINDYNNLYYCESIRAVNPCGEQPLPAYSACCLGSVNLTKFVRNPFEDGAYFDYERLEKVVGVAIRFLDNVVDLSWHPLESQRKAVKQHRRIGLGITGLGNAIAMMREVYGQAGSLFLIEKIMEKVRNTAYATSVGLAREKGSFPLFEAEDYLKGKYIQALPSEIHTLIKKHGLRNSHLLTAAPTGTTSLFARNISSGIEPVYDLEVERRIKTENGEKIVPLRDYAYDLYIRKYGEDSVKSGLPSYFVTTMSISPDAHIAVQSAVQKYIDSSISKTINLPENVSFEEFKEIYRKAYDKGVKGCTVYRKGCKLEGIISGKNDDKKSSVSATEIKQPVFKLAKRPESLQGETFKIKNPHVNSNLYVTINNIKENGRLRPFELFINTKDNSLIEWTTAFSLLCSSVLRISPDPTFLVEELKSIFSPSNQYFSPSRKKSIPSIPAEIGEILADFLEKLNPEELPPIEVYDEVASSVVVDPPASQKVAKAHYAICPKCNQRTLIREEGCFKCVDVSGCGYNKCA